MLYAQTGQGGGGLGMDLGGEAFEAGLAVVVVMVGLVTGGLGSVCVGLAAGGAATGLAGVALAAGLLVGVALAAGLLAGMALAAGLLLGLATGARFASLISCQSKKKRYEQSTTPF